MVIQIVRYIQEATSTTRNILNVENMDAVEKGMLVALNVENCQLRPLIARIETVHHDSLDVVWLEGSYTRDGKLLKRRMDVI